MWPGLNGVELLAAVAASYPGRAARSHASPAASHSAWLDLHEPESSKMTTLSAEASPHAEPARGFRLKGEPPFAFTA
jgi:hypothetical protein